jgi:hypothetical protein
MFQLLSLPGMAQSQGALLQQQLGLIQQQQALQPTLLQPVVQRQSLPSVVIPDPPTPVDPPAFVFTQVAPAAVWTITHNLNTFPSVTLTDALGNVILAQVQYISSNQVVATFSTPVAGSAYLNS